MSHEPLAIANKILLTAREQGKPLTIMQLIKLVYMAHGWTLALLNKPLVDEEPKAWQHGPVFPDIYYKFRGSGSQPIEKTAKHQFSGADHDTNLDENERSIVEQVVENYGNLHAFELSARTHQPDTPWSNAFDAGSGKFEPISNSAIKEHFNSLRA